MSRPWKSELRLELRTNGCYAELRGRGWNRKVMARASAAGRGASAITAAIAALRMAETQLHAADARLVVGDEYVDFALLGAEVNPANARQHAVDLFSSALGHGDLLVQAMPLPGERGWLAAAIDKTDYTAWTDALHAANIQLRHVHPALIEDLRGLSEQIKEDDALLVLLREEGATLLRLEDGVPASVAWERFDPANRVALEVRLHSFAWQTGAKPGQPTVIYMLPQSKALCRFVWDGRELAEPPVRPVAARCAAGRHVAAHPLPHPVEAVFGMAAAPGPARARARPQGLPA